MANFPNPPPPPPSPVPPIPVFGGAPLSIWDTPQVYETIQVSNRSLALYQLWIEPFSSIGPSTSSSSIGAVPAAAAPPADPTGQGVTNFIFPLSPESLNYSVVNLTSYFETQGISPAIDQGVRRIVDQYGVSPPVISISGTTGYKFHSLDGFQWDGKQSILRLEALIRTYAIQVQQQAAVGQPLPKMFFNDSWKQLTWQVVPIGPQNFQMSAGRPLFTNYIISFLAVQSANSQINTTTPNSDFIVNSFFSPQPIVSLTVQAFWEASFESLANGLTNIIGGPSGPLSQFAEILQGPPAP